MSRNRVLILLSLLLMSAMLLTACPAAMPGRGPGR